MTTSVERDQRAAVERAQMQHDIAELSREVADLRTDIKDLVDAWRNANFAIATIRWLAGVILAASALYFALTHFGEGK